MTDMSVRYLKTERRLPPEFILRTLVYLCSALNIGAGAGLLWGWGASLLTFGVVMLVWSLFIDFRLIVGDR